MNKPKNTHSAARPGSLLVIFLTVFVDLLGFGMVIPLLPIYADQFSTDESGLEVGLLMASFSAMQFLISPIWGSLSDRVGRRPVIMIGLFGSTVFYTLFGLATVWQSIFWVFVSRIGAGICAATIPTAQAYIADTTTAEKRTHGMALIGMAFGLGFTFGPLLGVFAVTAAAKGEYSALPGYIAAGLSGTAFLLAMFLLPESKTKDSTSAARKLIDIPAIKVAIKRKELGFILTTLFVCVFSFAMFETTLSLLIVNDPFNYDLEKVCFFYAFIGFSLAIVQGGIVRQISKRFADSILAQWGAGIKVIGLSVVAFAVSYQSEWLLYASMLIIVTGFSFLQPSVNAMLSKSVDQQHYGMVMGLGQSVNAMARILGAFLGILLLKQYVLSPYLLGASLMIGGVVLVRMAAAHDSETNDVLEDSK